MLTLSETIAKEVRDHSTQKSRTRKAIKSATSSIKDLVSKIKHIKEKVIDAPALYCHPYACGERYWLTMVMIG
jgi:hypothetical protein